MVRLRNFRRQPVSKLTHRTNSSEKKTPFATKFFSVSTIMPISHCATIKFYFATKKTRNAAF